MRLGILKAVGHNIADSLASGIGLMIGVYEIDVFGEAARSEPGYIEVDFLRGDTCGAPASPSLKKAVELYAAALPGLCEKHQVAVEDFAALRVRFGTDSVAGRHFRVSLEDAQGRRSDELYLGSPGRRFQISR